MSTTTTEVKPFVNSALRKFSVRYVPVGAVCGPRDNLTNTYDRPTVEFFDATNAYTGRFNPLGQFVSSYFVADILATTLGLDLYGGVSEWGIDALTMDNIREWLREVSA